MTELTILCGVLVLSLVLVIFGFSYLLLRLHKDYRQREWELQERIREPQVQVPPPEAVEKASDRPPMEFQSDEDEDEYAAVGRVFENGMPSRDA